MAGDREGPVPLTEAEDMINGGRNSPGPMQPSGVWR